MLAAVVLTIIVNGERDVGCDDVIEADLAVLRWAVGINGFHPYNTIKQTTLGHRCLIPTLHKDRRELVHIVYTNVHGGPGKRRLRDIRAIHTFLQKPDFHLNRRDLLLVRLLAVAPVRTFSAVICLDGEAVLLLAFTVQRLLGPNQTFSSGAI